MVLKSCGIYCALVWYKMMNVDPDSAMSSSQTSSWPEQLAASLGDLSLEQLTFPP